MPIFKCKGPGCHFSTEELDAYVDHVVGHRLEKAQTTELEPARAEPKRHRSAKEFVDCPECRGALLREFEAAGWKVQRPEEKPPAEETKKRGLFR